MDRAMKYLDEYRNRELVKRLAAKIKNTVSRRRTLMEVCGGQTHAILRFGIDTLLDESVTLVHGPGCPVCVTPVSMIDKAIALARYSAVTLCTFGDMMRVPGTEMSLLEAKACGAKVRMVYSPLDAVSLAKQDPENQYVFFAVGFETTAPANALAVYQADQQGIENFAILSTHVLVRPAMETILRHPDCRIEGFLAAGHVCTITGYAGYEDLSQRYGVPIVVTGFEPVDILSGVLYCVQQLETGKASVENAYARSVQREGNKKAWSLVETVFMVADQEWRGMGTIPNSGLQLRQRYHQHDAAERFDIEIPEAVLATPCRAAEVLQGFITPHECPAFGLECTPESPIGAPMVSNEGACAAYYRYRRSEPLTSEK